MLKPEGFEKWNPAMRGAYRKGYEAGAAGLGLDACPYQDKRKDCGRLTWSRAFQAVWRDGWGAGRLHKAIAFLDMVRECRRPWPPGP